MDAKEKAMKIALGTVAVLAVAMFAYYWFAWRNRTTQNDVNVNERVEASAEEKSEVAGVYSAADTVEGLERRLNFFSVAKKDDGSGYFGSAKLSRIAASDGAEEFLNCHEVKIAEPDFFIKCSSPELGQISFVGEWKKVSGVVQVSGKLLWAKDGNVVTEKSTTLNYSPGG